MYATLQINPEKNSFDNVEVRPIFHLACVNCRAKKVFYVAECARSLAIY